VLPEVMMMAIWKRALVVVATVLVLSQVSLAQTKPGVRAVSLELRGSTITVQEFLSLADPAMLHRIPRDAWQTEVTWAWDTATQVSRWAGKTPPKDGAGDVQPTFLPIWVVCTNSISDMGQRDVYYGASSTVVSPPFLRMPYMDVTARLWWLVGDGPICR